MSKSGYKMYRALNVFVSIVMAGFLVISIILTTLTFTFGNESFINKQIRSSSDCKAQTAEFYEKLDLIAQSNNIPSEVLSEAMKSSSLVSVQQISMRALYTQKDFSIKQIENIEGYYTTALKEYSAKYSDCLSDSEIEGLVDEIAQAIDDCFKIDNISDFSLFAIIFNTRRLPLIDVVMFVATIGCAIIVALMNDMRKSTLIYLGISFATAGEICVAVPLCYRYLNIGKGIAMTNITAYNRVIEKVINYHQQITIVCGAVAIIIAIIMFVSAYNHYKPILRNVDYERELDKNLL